MENEILNGIVKDVEEQVGLVIDQINYEIAQMHDEQITLFKEGLQKFAGQSARHAAYSSASKILHPSAWVVTIRDDKFYKFTVFELYRSLLNIVAQIKIYVARYREMSVKPGECDVYLRSIDGYLAMIARNNKIIADKYAGK